MNILRRVIAPMLALVAGHEVLEPVQVARDLRDIEIAQLEAKTLAAEQRAREARARSGRRVKAWHNIGASNGHRRWSPSRERRLSNAVRAAIELTTEANKLRKKLEAAKGAA